MRLSRTAAALTLLAALAAATVQAQAPPPPAAGQSVVLAADAEDTRRNLEDLLRRQPPALSQVLALDPSLLHSPEYLAAYPELANFVRAHPEVARDPSFFLGSGRREPTPRSPGLELFGQLMEMGAAITVTLVVIAALMWLIRTVIEQRRWSRLSRVQTEVHTKILDRFTSNEDLLGYMRTEAGSRFLVSAPIPLEPDTRAPGAPLSRILWSIQAGVILLALGVGMRLVSGKLPADAIAPFAVLGMLVVALGLGFLASAAVSFYLSRRMGLLPDQAAPARRTEPAAHA